MHTHGLKFWTEVCVRKRNIINLNVQAEQFRERRKKEGKEKHPLLMKSDENMTIFALGFLLRHRLHQKRSGENSALAVGGRDSANHVIGAALPKSFEIHLRSIRARNPVQLRQSPQTPRSIKDSSFATPARTWVSDLCRICTDLMSC